MYLPNPYGNYFGMRVIEDKNLVDKIQKRKHKKKRINKKWLKKYGYYKVPKKEVYVTNNIIIGHPSVINKIKQYCDNL